jgi:hypothetical protein
VGIGVQRRHGTAILAEEKKGIYNMLGEFCREAAVLIFVFSNLDLWLYRQTNDWEVVKHFLQALGVAAVFQVTGMLMEKWRRNE